MGEFPIDTSVVWFNVKSDCAQMEVKSATLAKALGKDDIEGYALVEFDAFANGSYYYNPADVATRSSPSVATRNLQTRGLADTRSAAF